MRIIMQRLAAGPTGIWQPGQELNLPDDQAKALITAGAAVPVRVRPVERAVVAPPETAAPVKGKRTK